MSVVLANFVDVQLYRHNQKVLDEEFSKITLSETQTTARDHWLELLSKNELEKEVENYRNFEDIILRDILGFPEKILRKGQNKNNVEFAYKDKQDRWAVLFEAKGHETQDLFAKQNRKKETQETPVIQTDTNMGRFSGISYGVCTNYQDFVLIDSYHRLTKPQKFDFVDTKNNDEKLKEFVGLFSYNSLVEKRIHSDLYRASIDVDKEFTNEFYKLFHETRLMIIKSFKEKENVTQTEAELYAQIFLDRLLFLFFALDKELIPDQKLFVTRILNQLKLEQCTSNSKKIFDDINLLFTALDVGDEELKISGFNGSFFSGKIPDKVYFLDYQKKDFFEEEFQNSKLTKILELNEDQEVIFKKFESKVNPIVKNLLIMDSYDFNSQINETILGHILEQSIEDFDKFKKSGNVQRKIHGVFYTPESMTDYICKNTIIPYLSENNSNTISDLIYEYENKIDVLQKKLEKIKIIDPACGSGAFLIKSAEILLEIKKQIDVVLGAKQTQIREFFPQKEISQIIQKNIFGVDINEKSVEITKLSLFLKMAKIDEPLTDLSSNIIRGNSLIESKDVDQYAIIWNEKFSRIFEDGGFDIVLGNPPWQEVQPNIDEFFSTLKNMQSMLSSKFPGKKKQFSLLPKRTKLELIDECLEDVEIKSLYDQYVGEYHAQKNYFIDPKNYQYQVSKIRGKTVAGIGINLYKLFIEKAHEILKKNGVLGFVLPSGIYTHAGSITLRKLLLENYTIKEFIGFHNTNGIFQDVHRQEKFCTLICEKGGKTKKFLASFYVVDDNQLKNFKEFAFEYDVDFIKLVSPDQLIFLECKNHTQFEIFEKLHKFPFLHSPKWKVKASREFNMSDDADLFHEANIGFPLFKGEMIHMFSDNFAPPIFWIEEDEGKHELERKELKRLKKLTKENISPQIHCDDYRFVWRKLTNPTNTRTMITTILPPDVFLADSLYYIHPVIFDNGKYRKQFSYMEILFLCGVCNSFVPDYILRNKIESNLTIAHFLDLPIPNYDETNPLHKKIVQNTAKLVCTTNSFEKLRKQLKIENFVTDVSKRLALEAQINGYVAKIYGLKKSELEYIFEMFPSVDENLKKLSMDEFLIINSKYR